jgi:hypothetical protein
MKRAQRWFVRNHYITENLIWAWLALAAVTTGVVALIDPTSLSGPIRSTKHPWDFVWNIGFAISGTLKLAGLFGRRPDIEAMGMMLLSGSLLAYFVAVVAYVGFVPATLTYPILVVAGVFRVLTLISLARLHTNDERRGPRGD